MRLCLHDWIWLPATTKTDHSNGNLLMLDLGVCSKCRKYKSRVTVATPGQQLSAQLWGEQRFEVIKVQTEEL